MSVITKHPATKTASFALKLEHLALENLYLKVAETQDEIRSAQALRYQVFYDEMGAVPDARMQALQREEEAFDPHCDHLLVVDKNAASDRNIVGTYRVLWQETAEREKTGFYTETEFDLGKLRATGGHIMEVSRSCVHKDYRSKMVINLLWKGIAAYVFANDVDYLIGTPSLSGMDIQAHTDALAYLNAFHLAPEEIRPHVREEFYQPLPAKNKDCINARHDFMALPPLLKGYLRMGAVIGDGAYIDHQFNCIDVAIIVPMADLSARYLNHYKRPDGR
ncbi:MAG: hemolysin [Alphaproteobacteria bacterium]|nr:hemolysin [Alphaproteobacteria bacterium]